MPTNPISTPTASELAIPARRPGLLPLLVLAMALVCLAIVGPGRSAFAAEFEPKPHIDTVTECRAGDPANYEVVRLHLTNTGTDFAHFTVTQITNGGSPFTSHYTVAADGESFIEYFFHEGDTGSVDAVADEDDTIEQVTQQLEPVDCIADPTGLIELQCPTKEGDSATVTMAYANPSPAAADFVLNNPNGTFLKVDDVHDQAEPVKSVFPVAEDSPVTASILADGKVLASLDQKVDCAENIRTITVSKTVHPDYDNQIDQNPAFTFTVSCGILVPSDLVSTFQLHGGESKSVQVPDGQFCSASEVDPGEYWAPRVATDGVQPVDGLTSTVVASFLGDHQIDFDNWGVPHPSVFVTKHVIGGTPGQKFDFVLHCKGDKGKPSSVQKFQLGDGETAKLSTFGTDGCVVTEAPAGGQWTTTHQLDDGAVTSGASQQFESHFPHSVDFVNTLPKEPTTTTTSTTTPETTTTTPTPTVPDPTTTEPPTTLATTTTEPAPTTTEATPTTETVVVSAESVVPAPPADPPVTLARTGSDVSELAFFGLLLIAAGVMALAVVRRRTGGTNPA